MSWGGTLCRGQPTSQHPTPQHPTYHHPTSQHPSPQRPMAQHPMSQHPTPQHPTPVMVSLGWAHPRAGPFMWLPILHTRTKLSGRASLVPRVGARVVNAIRMSPTTACPWAVPCG
uniref:Uncharacterized protein n=1 Tax=Anas platyrhynchos TaxID=8839 RepID=A0A8B9SVT3_ANAPL